MKKLTHDQLLILVDLIELIKCEVINHKVLVERCKIIAMLQTLTEKDNHG